MRILTTMLESSLAEADSVVLTGVIADHQRLARERRAREARLTGLGWLRKPRRAEIEAAQAIVDEYELV